MKSLEAALQELQDALPINSEIKIDLTLDIHGYMYVQKQIVEETMRQGFIITDKPFDAANDKITVLKKYPNIIVNLKLKEE